jgi:hypothetical protein
MNDYVPSEFYLGQNYPNPFGEKTTIKFCVAYKTKVKVTIFDNEGEELEKLVDEEKQPGTYEVTWYAADLPGGVYFYQLKSDEYIQTRKMLLST